MPTKEKITIWLDRDGIIKDDVVEAFRSKGFGPRGAESSHLRKFAYNTFKELMFVSLHLCAESAAQVLKGDSLPPREGIIDMAKGWIEEGRRKGVDVEIGIITSNHTVDLEKLASLFKEAGVEAHAVRVKRSMDKGKYLGNLQGRNVLVDDNPLSFLRLDTEHNCNYGIALHTDYTDMMRRVIVNLKGISDAKDLQELNGKVLELIRSS